MNDQIINLNARINNLNDLNSKNQFSYWDKEGRYHICKDVFQLHLRHFDTDYVYRKFTEYFSSKCFNEFYNQEILIYISNLIETGKTKKAKSVLYEYIKIHGNLDIWKFLPVAKFAFDCGYTDELIDKAALVYVKLLENSKNFENLISDKTIAIIGNGPSEIGKNKGEEIDSHDIVIRMNNYQIKGFEQDYGAKTDVWIRGFGGSDLKDYTKDNKYIFAGITGDFKHIPLFWEFQLNILYRDLIENNINSAYINSEIYQRLTNEYSGDPTTGFSTIFTILELNKSKKVDIYGFSFQQTLSDGYATHYFNDREEDEARKRSSNHCLDEETEFLVKYLNNK